MTISILLGTELTIGGGITIPAIIDRVRTMAGPEPVILATARAVQDRCLVATDRFVFVCADTTQEPPLLQRLPYENLRLVTIGTTLGSPSISILTTRGVEMTFRMAQPSENDVSQLAGLINRKMNEYPAPAQADGEPQLDQDSPDKQQPDKDAKDGSFVGQALVDVGDIVSEVHGPLGIGLMVGGVLMDLASRATSAASPEESAPAHTTMSDACSLRSDRLDIGEGITNPSTIEAIRHLLSVDETILATMQGTGETSLVMTSVRILIAEESDGGNSTVREIPFHELATVEAAIQSDPCILCINPKEGKSLSVQVPHRHYNQVNELTSRLVARMRSALK